MVLAPTWVTEGKCLRETPVMFSSTFKIDLQADPLPSRPRYPLAWLPRPLLKGRQASLRGLARPLFPFLCVSSTQRAGRCFSSHILSCHRRSQTLRWLTMSSEQKPGPHDGRQGDIQPVTSQTLSPTLTLVHPAAEASSLFLEHSKPPAAQDLDVPSAQNASPSTQT